MKDLTRGSKMLFAAFLLAAFAACGSERDLSGSVTGATPSGTKVVRLPGLLVTAEKADALLAALKDSGLITQLGRDELLRAAAFVCDVDHQFPEPSELNNSEEFLAGHGEGVSDSRTALAELRQGLVEAEFCSRELVLPKDLLGGGSGPSLTEGTGPPRIAE